MWRCFLPFWCIFSQISQTIKLAKKWCAEDVEAQRSKLTSHGLSLWLLSRWRWGCWPLGRRGGEWLGRWLRQHGLHHFQPITSHSHSWLRQHGHRQKGKKQATIFQKLKEALQWSLGYYLGGNLLLRVREHDISYKWRDGQGTGRKPIIFRCNFCASPNILGCSLHRCIWLEIDRNIELYTIYAWYVV